MTGPILEARGLGCTFGPRRPWGPAPARVLDGVDLAVGEGETVSVVGESGSGKTTLVHCALGLITPTAGEIRFRGEELRNLPPSGWRAFRRSVQLVQQDAAASLDPRMDVRALVGEGLAIHEPGDPGHDAAVRAALVRVGLGEDLLGRRPRQLSGGQGQRVALARALVLRPALLVCDEPTSAQDLATRRRLLDLLLDLRAREGLALLLVTHDLGLVQELGGRVLVLDGGRVVEEGPVEAVFGGPTHPRTRRLLEAVPARHPRQRRRPGSRLRETAQLSAAASEGGVR